MSSSKVAKFFYALHTRGDFRAQLRQLGINDVLFCCSDEDLVNSRVREPRRPCVFWWISSETRFLLCAREIRTAREGETKRQARTL